MYVPEDKYGKVKDHGPLPLVLLLAPGLSVPASIASLSTFFSVVELARGTPSETMMYGKLSTQIPCFPIDPRSVWSYRAGGLDFFLAIDNQTAVPSDQYSLVL